MSKSQKVKTKKKKNCEGFKGELHGTMAFSNCIGSQSRSHKSQSIVFF